MTRTIPRAGDACTNASSELAARHVRSISDGRSDSRTTPAPGGSIVRSFVHDSRIDFGCHPDFTECVALRRDTFRVAGETQENGGHRRPEQRARKRRVDDLARVRFEREGPENGAHASDILFAKLDRE